MSRPFRVAILTVSDTAAQDAQKDLSGPTIREILHDADRHGKFEVTKTGIVHDESEVIRETVLSWCDSEQLDWIITTGGTGFGTRDCTPEAISVLIERPAPGLVHLLLSSSLSHTVLAALSRPVAGTIRKSLVVTLPGSPKAVKENLTALLGGGLVEHALDLIRGGTGKAVHEQLQLAVSGHTTPKRASTIRSVPPTPQGHHDHHAHHHHHRHHGDDHEAPTAHTILSHDPSLPASARHRVSPFPLITLEKALSIVLHRTKALDVLARPVNGLLLGHVLAEDVFAPQNIPNTPTTNVDGYALLSTFPKGTYNVETPKTHPMTQRPPIDTIVRINTGGPLPYGTNAVIMVEDTRLVATAQDANGEGEDESKVETLAVVQPGENVRQPGSDVMKDEKVCEWGQIIGTQGGELGSLAFIGRKEVRVYRKPVVAILSTGDELLDIDTELPSGEQGVSAQPGADNWGGIWDTNRPSLRAALQGLGYEVVDLGIVVDKIDTHVAALRDGLEKADVILTTGGTSMGSTDLLKPIIERHLGGTIHFGRVAVKPGKPTTFATIPISPPGGTSEAATPDTPQATTEENQKYIFALPGNPASALVMFWVFVVPALRKLGGWPREQCSLPRAHVKLSEDVFLDPRPEFHRVIIKCTNTGLVAYSTGGQRSSRVASLAGANGFLALPAKTAAKDRLTKGSFCEAVIIGELRM